MRATWSQYGICNHKKRATRTRHARAAAEKSDPDETVLGVPEQPHDNGAYRGHEREHRLDDGEDERDRRLHDAADGDE